ncbi:MAG TPA: 5'-methylthioadenosine/S-adenosylhomocysteine nucleosidase, partial [Trebonia sp.]|nr:5'-methylthioadenosine/S-adenosylhomocysteine nucleosidase [Trebonia sp.]
MSERPVVILTALDLEYDAVRGELRDLTTRVHPAGTRFEIGRLGPNGPLVALTLTGKGNLPAGTLTERAIAQFSPTAVIFVGVAGARQSNVALGDVVVATHVYAYHGATSEDDGTRARPRVWETAHNVDQTARHVARDGGWLSRLPADASVSRVHFGPIAAGERVIDSRTSPDALWLREHYNDAIAVEMEAAGVAQASHLNDSLPMAVVRGISDPADGTKVAADRAGWQRRAASRAAAFALALAAELDSNPPRRPGQHHDAAPPVAPVNVTNSASGNARVGTQAGQIFGGVWINSSDSSPSGDVLALLADLRTRLDQAR